ncbi:integrin alpha-8-like [Rhinoraja longicauda]
MHPSPTPMLGPRLWPLMGTLLLFSCLLLQLRAFNIDAENPAVYSGPEGSYFGYSVEFYMPEAGSPGILIGAPKANTTQENINEGGAVFLCPWSANGSLCSLIPFDTKGDWYIDTSTELMMDHKSNQWFGATVKAYKEKIVACAPLYRWQYVKKSYGMTLTGGNTPVGSCWIAAANLSSYAEYSPCRSKFFEKVSSDYVPDQRFCEAGWSCEITEGGEIVLGAPGSFFWQGQLIAADIDQIVHKYNRNDPLKVLSPSRQTEDAKGYQDNIFLGSSLAMGEFTGDSVKEYVVGAPRGKSTLGSVNIIRSTSMATILIIIGEQVAAYFGYAVAVVDINSDGKDDILVGAPLFMSQGQDDKLHELGRLYLYLQEQPGAFKKPHQTFTGTDKFGRFGSAIASLGDIDYDGYKDVAVGAPLAGEDGNGRVFIYLGHATGLHQRPFQQLKGMWATDVKSAAFGFSLKGGLDIDSNNFPDLIVGAHNADKVLVYRAKPVVTAEVKLLNIPNTLNPELKSCKLPNANTLVTCFVMKMCVKVTGRNALQHYVLNVQIELDKNKQRSQRRILFLHSHQAQEQFRFPPVKNEAEPCEERTVYLRDEAQFKDKLSPIVVTGNCSLEEPMNSSGALPAMLAPHSQVLVTKKLRILLNCGPDNVCIPNLKLSATTDKDHLIAGISNPLTMVFNAVNEGEGSYETELHIPLPPQIDFISVVRDNENLTKLSCNPIEFNGTQTVICDLGNPMASDLKLSTGLHFMVHSLELVASVTISMQIKSKNSQNPDSEVVNLKLQVKAVAQLVLRGTSRPERIILPFINFESPSDVVVKNSSLPEIAHVYELYNKGPSAISKAIVEMAWPSDFNGINLLFKSMIVPMNEIKCTVNSTEADNWVLSLSTEKPYTTEYVRHELNKREVNKPEALVEETILNLTCDASKCVKIVCYVGRLERNKRAVISIQSTLRMEPFIKNQYKQYTFQSRASFIVQEMPYKVQPEEFPSGNSMVESVIECCEPEGSKPVPVWYIIVAILGGLLLIASVTLLLWKCGFFKRKLPPTETEDLL